MSGGVQVHRGGVPISTVTLVGTDAGKPAAAIAGRLYFANDTGILYRDTGAAWTAVSPLQGAGLAPTADGAFGYDTTRKALVAGGNQAVSGRIPRVVHVDDDVATGGNSLDAGTIGTTETAFGSKYAVPANFMVAKKLLRVTWLIEQVVPAASTTVLMRLRWGGVAGTILSTAAAQSAGANTTNTMASIWHVYATAAPGAAVNLHATTSTGVAAIAGLRAHTAQPVAAATNAAADLVLTIQYGAATAGNINKAHFLLVEELN